MIETKTIWQPTDLKEAWELQFNQGTEDYCFVSGGTWLRTQWEADLREMPANLISLERISELTEVKEALSFGRREIVIGSQVTLATCINHPILQKYVAPLVEACKKIAAPSIRNLATIGGNVYTAAGDTIPVFLIYNTTLRWFNGTEIETESLEQWLQALQTNQFKRDQRILVDIVIEIAESQEGDFSFFTKVGRRETFTAAVATVAGKGTLSEDGLFENITLAAGGGPIPLRLASSETELIGKAPSESLFQEIYPIIVNEYRASSDAFSSENYKKIMVANLIVSELMQCCDGKEGVSYVARSSF
ncbi:xanthine dehydrogenase [Halalkalibacter wakoensis JCM 9140]|uniref:Xanthine dehydrogenase n=1 Tax=Halalkalibacter wakoensis JCM 9140 TaxID=1236970 RepID=W4Q404_9BACI|nr:FAD binding domain-containing protein [Halalkalibacter wakoensis]GAE26094.1 xanthine dehydrogenase [Halalkalibacter wakoensis JCM 9140]